MRRPLALLIKGLKLVIGRLHEQGLKTTLAWAYSRLFILITGRPAIRHSQITAQLYIGGQIRKCGWLWLEKQCGLTAVVNMRAELDDLQVGIRAPAYLWLPVNDDEPPSTEQLHKGVKFIGEQIKSGGKVYIHCAAGSGRAPIMGAAYLIANGLGLEEALALIRRFRPFIRPVPAQMEQLRQFANAIAVESSKK